MNAFDARNLQGKIELNHIYSCISEEVEALNNNAPFLEF